MDVEAWLGGLGLQQYQAAFRDNEIDGAVLRDLTADDLRELGVASVGHRRKLLSAISELSAASDSSDGHVVRATPGARRRRAPPADGDVLRSRRLDRDVGAARSRGHARDHRRLSSMLRDADRAQRRLRRQIHGRRRARLFRLSAGARARRRARRAGRARDRRGCAETADRRRRAAACAGRDRDGDRGRRRSHGIGRGAGARRRRRHAEPRGAAARRSPSPTASSSPRARASCSATCSNLHDLGPQGPQGHRRADAGLGGAAAKVRRRAASRRCTRAA